MGYEWVPLLLARLVGIEPYEVRQVLEEDRPRWPRRVLAGDLPLLAVWGRTGAGRHLIVLLKQAETAYDWLIVGAREMTAEQVAEYDRWEAEHGH